MLQPPDMDCFFCFKVHEWTQYGDRRAGKRDMPVSHLCCGCRCHPWILGVFIESDLLPVPEYVGGNWRLPGTVADHEFQHGRQVLRGMESVFLYIQGVGRRRRFSLDMGEDRLYLYWDFGSGGVAWNHETARQVIPVVREIILRVR